MSTEPVLIKIADAAQMIQCSRATIYRMLLAGEYDAKIEAGKKSPEDVPADVRPYLGCGFPPQIRIGPQTSRLERAKVEEWIKAQCTTPCTTANP